VAINVSVHRKHNESTERLIRRFIKKVKREGVLTKYRERCSYYIKPAVKRKIKSEKARRERERVERKRNKRK